MNDLLLQERAIYQTPVVFVRAYGYDSDDPNAHHVFQHDWTIPGPPPAGSGSFTGPVMAGDQAALVEWKTDQLSSRGKPIYLRKYIHHGTVGISGGDSLDTGYKAILQNYADVMKTFHGGIRGRTTSGNVVAALVSPWVTTRTLKRRGKRPLPRTLSTPA
jgi:hypothetical protein